MRLRFRSAYSQVHKKSRYSDFFYELGRLLSKRNQSLKFFLYRFSALS